jgi:hypothetical protein
MGTMGARAESPSREVKGFPPVVLVSVIVSWWEFVLIIDLDSSAWIGII